MNGKRNMKKKFYSKILKTVRFSIIIATTSNSVTVSKTRTGLTVTTIQTGTFCGLVLSNIVSYQTFCEPKQKSIEKLYETSQ